MRNHVLDGTRRAKFCRNGLKSFCSLNSCFCRASGVTSLFGRFFFFGGGCSSLRLQPTFLDGCVRKIRQVTSFRVRKCLLGVAFTIHFILRPLNFRKKTAIFENEYDWTVFLRPKTALTWGCSIINYP